MCFYIPCLSARSPNLSPQIPLWATKTTSLGSMILQHAASIPAWPKMHTISFGNYLNEFVCEWEKAKCRAHSDGESFLERKLKQLYCILFPHWIKEHDTHKKKSFYYILVLDLIYMHIEEVGKILLTSSRDCKCKFVFRLKYVLDAFFDFIENLKMWCKGCFYLENCQFIVDYSLHILWHHFKRFYNKLLKSELSKIENAGLS